MTQIPASLFLRNLAKIDPLKLIVIKGVGEVMVENLQNFCQSQNYQNLIAKFEKLESQDKGLKIILSTKKPSENTPQKPRKIVCITGTFDISRSEIVQILESKNYKVSSTLTKETEILLVGDKPGSKVAKAQKMGITILENWQTLG